MALPLLLIRLLSCWILYQSKTPYLFLFSCCLPLITPKLHHTQRLANNWEEFLSLLLNKGTIIFLALMWTQNNKKKRTTWRRSLLHHRRLFIRSFVCSVSFCRVLYCTLFNWRCFVFNCEFIRNLFSIHFVHNPVKPWSVPPSHGCASCPPPSYSPSPLHSLASNLLWCSFRPFSMRGVDRSIEFDVLHAFACHLHPPLSFPLPLQNCPIIFG